MKRRIALLLTAALVSLIAPSPASAHSDVCGGQGIARLGGGFGLPPEAATVDFTFQYGVLGVCASTTSLTAIGTVTGACGLSTGSGITNSGHTFSFTSQGTVLILTGQVTGSMSAVADPGAAGNCVDGNATRFLITGVATLTHPS